MMDARIRVLTLVFSMAGASACGGTTTTETSGGTTCYTDSLCGSVTILEPDDSWCEGSGEPKPLSIYLGGAECVLKALRDGTKGRFLVDRTPSSGEGPGYCGLLRRIQILDDRQAIVAESEREDLGGSDKKHSGELKPAEDYQKCLDDGSSAWAACIADAVVIKNDSPTCECDYCEPAFELPYGP